MWNIFYKHALTGLDKEYIAETTKNGELIIRYKNLAPGNYIFKAQIINENKINAQKTTPNVKTISIVFDG